MKTYKKLSKDVKLWYEIEDNRVYIEELSTKEEKRNKVLGIFIKRN